ncbi:MAG: phosphoribosyl-ATP diphosphatase [Leptospirales bacterium]
MNKEESPSDFILKLQAIIQNRKDESPEGSYTASLFQKGIDRILQKVGEESVEYILASKNSDKERIVSEGADLVYHLLVSLSANNLSIEDLSQELQRRHGSK